MVQSVIEHPVTSQMRGTVAVLITEPAVASHRDPAGLVNPTKPNTYGVTYVVPAKNL
jgi:hypothetical protein